MNAEPRRESRVASPLSYVVTCEHATHHVPDRYRPLFEGRTDVLATHRAVDLGALPFAERLAIHLDVPLHATTVTRLLIDANRSESNRRLWSEFTRDLRMEEKERLLSEFHRPHHRAVADAVLAALETGASVQHIAVHSFTPVWEGVPRTADVGLLYDPSRRGETDFARHLQAVLLNEVPSLRVRRNYPYRGRDDGLPTLLRRRHATGYHALELELSQALGEGEPSVTDRILAALLTALRSSPTPRSARSPEIAR